MLGVGEIGVGDWVGGLVGGRGLHFLVEEGMDQPILYLSLWLGGYSITLHGGKPTLLLRLHPAPLPQYTVPGPITRPTTPKHIILITAPATHPTAPDQPTATAYTTPTIIDNMVGVLHLDLADPVVQLLLELVVVYAGGFVLGLGDDLPSFEGELAIALATAVVGMGLAVVGMGLAVLAG